MVYLSTESIDISLAFRLVSTDLYMSICLYAFINYFFVLSISFPFFGEALTLKERPGFNFCLFIFLVNSSFCCFSFYISYLLTWVSFFILRSLNNNICTFPVSRRLHNSTILLSRARVRKEEVADFSSFYQFGY